MYEHFYGFSERPFTLLPDPDFLYLDEKHRTALDLLEMAVFNRSGFCVISGEIGAGKTTLIRELLNRLDESVNVGLVSNTHPSFGELLQWVMAAFNLPCDTDDQFELHKQFVDYTIRQYAKNRHTLLIIDEAQNLTTPALEELRMLSNINSDKDLVLQVILVGQQQLRDRLQQPDLAQFAQRISLDYHLQGLTAEETRGYIQHRLRHAGGAYDLFDDAACQAVYGSSDGIPRLINRICDLSLMYGYTMQSRRIDAALVNRVIEDQRMGVLLDIPGPVPVTPPPVQPEADARHQAEDGLRETATQEASSSPVPVMASEAALSESEPDSEPAAEGLAGIQTAEPGKIIVSLEETDADGCPLSSDTIVGAMSHALFRTAPGTPSPDTAVGDSTAARTDDLHTLVVDAERRGRMRGERMALWLLLGVVVLIAGTGWLMRDTWIDRMSASSGIPVQQVPSPVGAEKSESLIVREADKPEQVLAAERAAAEQAAAEQAAAEQAAAEQAAAEQAAAEQAAAEQAAAEQAAAEQAAAEQAAAEQAAAEQAAAEQAAALKQETERLARVRAEARRLAREQRAAEQGLARQRADRQALEREADAERRKLESARKTIEDIGIKRERARQAAASFAAEAPAAYDEDDGDAILQELIQQEIGRQ